MIGCCIYTPSNRENDPCRIYIGGRVVKAERTLPRNRFVSFGRAGAKRLPRWICGMNEFFVVFFSPVVGGAFGWT